MVCGLCMCAVSQDPRQLIGCIDFTYITDALTEQEALGKVISITKWCLHRMLWPLFGLESLLSLSVSWGKDILEKANKGKQERGRKLMFWLIFGYNRYLMDVRLSHTCRTKHDVTLRVCILREGKLTLLVHICYVKPFIHTFIILDNPGPFKQPKPMTLSSDVDVLQIGSPEQSVRRSTLTTSLQKTMRIEVKNGSTIYSALLINHEQEFLIILLKPG